MLSVKLNIKEWITDSKNAIWHSKDYSPSLKGVSDTVEYVTV